MELKGSLNTILFVLTMRSFGQIWRRGVGEVSQIAHSPREKYFRQSAVPPQRSESPSKIFRKNFQFERFFCES
jgi:hypothetical protein